MIEIAYGLHDLAAVYLIDGACELYAVHLGSRMAEDTSSYVKFVAQCPGPMIAWG